MKYRAILWMFVCCLGVALGSDVGRAQHSGGAHPSHDPSAAPQGGPADAKIAFENESIVVVRIRMAPHEKSPMHDVAGARLVVWLTDVELRDTRPDGSTDVTIRKAGEIDWVPAQRHAGENLSDRLLEFLAIVPKAAAAHH